MQLRTRKSGTALIRTVYDPAIKRCRAVVIGTLAHDAEELPDGLVERLTPDELRKVLSHLHAQTGGRRNQAQAAAGADLAQVIHDAATWYRGQKASHSLDHQAATARAEWTGLLAAMSAVGVGRTRQRRTSKVKSS